MSDSNTTISDLKQRVRGICEARDWDPFHSPKNLAAGVITEAAELLEHFRWLDDTASLELLSSGSAEAVRDELIDVLFFVVRFAQLYDIDLSTEFERKMLKNEAKYPVDKSRGSAKKYTEFC
jgi:NTP pyrophosphatase (non-canonical NTP hydrolase)